MLVAQAQKGILYIVNYIHPDVVQQIKNHQLQNKIPIIKKCNCSRAPTCTGAGCFETSTCITLNINLFDEIIQAEMLLENISFRISRGIPYDIIIGNFTFRDYDLSKIFRHLFASTNPIINQSSSAHSSNLPEDSLVSNPSHERQHVESTSGITTSGKPMIGSRRSKRLQGAGNLQSPVTDLGLMRENERLGTLWLSSIILKEDLFTQEEDDTYENDIPSNPIEDILNNVSNGWDDQSTDFKIKEILGNVYL